MPTAATTTSVLTCPACGRAEALEMPTNACLFFHECPGCRVVLRPRAGDCCVFCSYGSVRCPPVQGGGACGSAEARRGGGKDVR